MTTDFSDIQISSIMSKDLITVTEGTPLKDVIELFRKHHYHTYPVVTDEGLLAGTINQNIILDILLFTQTPRSKHTHLAAMRSLGEDARGIMISHPVTISQNANLIDAADMMLKHRADHICVMNDGKLVGVISKRDIITEVYKHEEMPKRVHKY